MAVAQGLPDQLATEQLASTNMAQLFLHRGDIGDAESVLVEVWNKEPGHPGIAANLAAVYAERANRLLAAGNKSEWLRNVEMALELSSIGIENAPNYPGFTETGTLVANKGRLLVALGRCDEAKQIFSEARRYPDVGDLPECKS